jgi:hypothetical protein
LVVPRADAAWGALDHGFCGGGMDFTRVNESAAAARWRNRGSTQSAARRG